MYAEQGVTVAQYPQVTAYKQECEPHCQITCQEEWGGKGRMP